MLEPAMYLPSFFDGGIMRALGVRHWDKEGFLHHSVSWRCVMMHGSSKTGLALKLAGFGNINDQRSAKY